MAATSARPCGRARASASTHRRGDGRLRSRGAKRWVAALDDDRNQVNILKTLLQSAHEYAARVAVFVVRGDALTGWAAVGFTGNGSATDNRVKSASIPLNADTVLRQVATADRGVRGRRAPAPAERPALRGHRQRRAGRDRSLPAGQQGPRRRRPLLPIRATRPSGLGSAAASRSWRAPRPCQWSSSPSAANGRRHGRRPRPPLRRRLRPARPPRRTDEPLPPRRPAARRSNRALRRPAPAAAPAAAAPGPPAGSTSPKLAARGAEAPRGARSRFARLLVSGIKLYNEAKVMEGRRSRDLYGASRTTSIAPSRCITSA